MKHFLLFVVAIAILLPLSSLRADESDIDKLSLLLGASNAGTEFLMTFHPCWETQGPNNAIRIYVASLYKTKVTLSIPGFAITIVKETIPNDVIEFTLKPTEAQVYSKSDFVAPQPSQVWEKRAIIITAEDPIICYGVTRFQYTSDGYMALPINVLGTDYQVASYADPTNNTGQFLPSYTSIVGAYDNTTVNFKLGGFETMRIIKENGDELKAGQSMTKMIHKGDVWLIAGVGQFNDLTGSNVNADKPVAVISGNFCAYIPTHIAACDYIIEQELPIYNWGKSYLVSPIAYRKKPALVKVFAAEANTNFSIDGIPAGKIHTAGGFKDKGYIETRIAMDTPKPARISSNKAINVVQYNPGQMDDGVESDPFQMQIMPVEQFQTDVIFNTPGIKGGFGFNDNYINIVYLAKADGTIPDDLMFAEAKAEELNWIPVKNISPSQGTPFYGEEKDGRQYYSKTLKLDHDGVYRMKADEPFAVYAYGYDWYDSYGFPASGRLIDMSSDDSLAPEIDYEMDENGNITGVVRDVTQPISKVSKDGDEVQTSNASGLSSVRLINALSDNYKLEYTPFIPGIDNETNFQINVVNKYKSSKAVLAVTDRRGNDKIVEFSIKATPVPTIVSTETYFGKLKSGKFEELEFALTNNESMSTVPVNSIVFQKNDTQFEIINNIEENTVLKPGEEHKFQVRFNARNMNEDDIKKIEGAFSNQIGIKLADGDVQYFDYLTAEVANPRLQVTGTDFATQAAGEPVKDRYVRITNPSMVDMFVTGFEVTGSSEFTFALPTVSEEEPLVVAAGREYNIVTSFTPTAPGEFAATLKVISDGYVIKDEAQITGVAIPSSVIDDKLFGGTFSVNYDGASITFRSEHDATLSGMKVYDLNGRTLFNSELTNNVNSYSAAVPGLTSGVYMLHLKINGIWMSKKISL
ncbi:MAG: T9SS type A sorting domain-containing protein [Candidatus Kapabacteria bacterium]|nr:T9SS type A sorting domain-containing protein [Candidatus Kapabacteria bacterium]